MRIIFTLLFLAQLAISAPNFPPPIWRNAWDTNQPPRPVAGLNNLSVSNLNSGTGWLFYGVSPNTVARLIDLTNVVAGAAITKNTNQFATNLILTLKSRLLITNPVVYGVFSNLNASGPMWASGGLTVPSGSPLKAGDAGDGIGTIGQGDGTIGSAGYGTAYQFLRMNSLGTLAEWTSNVITNGSGGTGITTNANQFLGVPLSIKDGAKLTNIVIFGTLSNLLASGPIWAAGGLTVPSGSPLKAQDAALGVATIGSDGTVGSAGYGTAYQFPRMNSAGTAVEWTANVVTNSAAVAPGNLGDIPFNDGSGHFTVDTVLLSYDQGSSTLNGGQNLIVLRALTADNATFNTLTVNSNGSFNTPGTNFALRIGTNGFNLGGSGDVNGSGTLSTVDSTVLQNWLLFGTGLTEVAYARADITGDGVVDWLDKSLLTQAILGNITMGTNHLYGKYIRGSAFSADLNQNVLVGAIRDASARFEVVGNGSLNILSTNGSNAFSTVYLLPPPTGSATNLAVTAGGLIVGVPAQVSSGSITGSSNLTGGVGIGRSTNGNLIELKSVAGTNGTVATTNASVVIIDSSAITNHATIAFQSDLNTASNFLSDSVFLGATLGQVPFYGGSRELHYDAAFGWNSGGGGTLSVNNLVVSAQITGNDQAAFIGSVGNVQSSSTVSKTELEYLDGVTSAIQQQLNGKVDELDGVATNLTVYTGSPGMTVVPKTGTVTNSFQILTTNLVPLIFVKSNGVFSISNSPILMSWLGSNDVAFGAVTQANFVSGITGYVANGKANLGVSVSGGGSSISTNANQFLGVPLSIKESALLTNIQAFGTNTIIATAEPSLVWSNTDSGGGLVRAYLDTGPTFHFYSSDLAADLYAADAISFRLGVQLNAINQTNLGWLNVAGGETNFGPTKLVGQVDMNWIATNGVSLGSVTQANWVSGVTGLVVNGKAILGVRDSGPSAMTVTNFVINQVYTNSNSNPILVNADVYLLTALINGSCSIDLMYSPTGNVNYVILSRVAIATLLTGGLSLPITNQICGVITNQGNYYFTNTSSGAGNSSGLVGNGQITVFGGVGAQGPAGSAGSSGFAALEIQTNGVRVGLITNVNFITSGWTGLVSSTTATIGSTLPDFQRFTNTATPGTWTKPQGATFVRVICIGGGGGGGGGTPSATNNLPLGGGGGGGGSYVDRLFLASDITSPVTATVGTNGPGGASVVVGSVGGNSTFGTYLTGYGGGGGNANKSGGSPSVAGGGGGGGSATAGATALVNAGGVAGTPGTGTSPSGGGGSTGGATAAPTGAEYGGAGGGGFTTAAIAFAGGSSIYGGAGGGAGGGIPSQGTNGIAGTGGNVGVYTAGGGGTNGVAGSASPGGNGANGDSTKCGQGGGGGAANNGVLSTGGNGGNGGLMGGGGGGGGAASTGGTGGTGGNGSRGEIRVYSW